MLTNRISLLVNLPIESIDKYSQQTRLEQIGGMDDDRKKAS